MHAQDIRRTDVCFVVEDLLTTETQIATTLRRLMTRYVLRPLNYVVLVGISFDSVNFLIETAGMAGLCQSATFVAAEGVGTLVPVPGVNALVLVGLLDDHAVLRGINA